MIRKNANYIRVVPRDLFNESKLLKCLDRLELIINHTGPNKIGLESRHDGEPFQICQNPDDGSIYCANYNVYLDGEHIHLFTPLNSKDEWPLFAIYKGQEYYMLIQNGEKFMIPNFGKVER